MGKPVLNYFAICGRGECARLVAALGGVEIEDKQWDPAFDETGGWRQGYQAIGNEFGFPGTMPVLVHDDLKLFQTAAIEAYLASISTKVFPTLTPAQKGIDMMYGQIKADINASTESLLFKKIEAKDLPPVLEKWYGYIEGLLPATGFINGVVIDGVATPTLADLAVLVIAQGCMPFQAAPKIAGFDWKASGKYPKMQALAEATAKFPAIAASLESSKNKTLTADPFGIMG